MARATSQKKAKEPMSPAKRRQAVLDAHTDVLATMALAAQTPQPKKHSEEEAEKQTNLQRQSVYTSTPPQSTMTVLTRYTLGAQAPIKKPGIRVSPKPSPTVQRSRRKNTVATTMANAPSQSAAVAPRLATFDLQCNWVKGQLESRVTKLPLEAREVSAFICESSRVMELSEQRASVIARAYYLLNLRDAVHDSFWDKAGTGFFWRPITPNHIKKLRGVLRNGLTSIVTAFQTEDSGQFSTEINNLFESVTQIIKDAQSKHPRYRSPAVKNLYQDTETAIQEIKNCNYKITQFPLSDRSPDPSLSLQR